ncbi:Site-specific recombinase XerD [Loktanella atrilutea]|uniref:Site-specific recombinase XerD n=1 Tax=Loktanella atrilutea TaxID=366533 RepID=A0A1M4SUF1_LOKAT|nr:tyrosine-type recombinase/integrase [Loktanella atrilutea]SHE35860.1 Site-specific recombinase XerD [Loktanella atrilutea]
MLKHVKIDANGRYRYRRRVPQALQATLGVTEFIKTLGRTEREAIAAYGPYHHLVEQQIAMSRAGGTLKSSIEAKGDIRSFFQMHKLDPYSSGKTESEQTGREAYADEIIEKYHRDPITGHPEDITPEDRAMVIALHSGIEAVVAEPTITDAFKLYLKEKALADPFKRQKQINNFNRIERDALAVWHADLPLKRITRQNAKDLRDHLLTRMKPDSVKRQINNIKAVVAYACREFEVPRTDVFLDLSYPKEALEDREKRLPLSPDIIDAMYGELKSDVVLSDVWTLIHYTGAQNAELLSLEVRHINVDHKVPHVIIEATDTRSLKDGWRKREVPLVGKALAVAKRIVEQANGRQFVFPEYALTSKHDLFSNKMMKRLRRHTKDPRHSLYSLRHSMKDALRDADVSLDLQEAILGHSTGSGSQANYGSGHSLERKQAALLKVFRAT